MVGVTAGSSATVQKAIGWPAATVPFAMAIAVVASVYLFAPNFRFSDAANAGPPAGDFLQEWLGGYIVRAGDHSRFYDVQYAQALQHDPALVGFRWSRSQYLPIVYPPFYYLLVSPLSLLPFRSAAWIWNGLMVGCLAATAALAWRTSLVRFGDAANVAVGYEGKKRQALQTFLPWTLPLAVLFVPLLENLVSSQKGTLCLLLLAATYVLLRAERPFWAGIVFGLLAFKPQLTLVIALAMLAKRQWRFVLGGATTGAVLIALSLYIGVDVCRQYVEFSRGAAHYMQTAGYDLHKAHCWYGFFTLLAAGHETVWVQVGTLLACIATLALLVVVLRGPLSARAPHFGLQFAALVLASVLLSPHLFTYDLTILLLPMFVILHWPAQEDERNRGGSGMIWLMAALYALAGLSPGIAEQLHIQISTLLIFALLAAIALVVRHQTVGD